MRAVPLVHVAHKARHKLSIRIGCVFVFVFAFLRRCLFVLAHVGYRSNVTGSVHGYRPSHFHRMAADSKSASSLRSLFLFS